ncbi:L-fucose/L-arabinose isomerase family protein [Domibacillus indicus]|uniref:L-fucose/L-arabinose isomerase family protein n=1 Tax=Domibacillus indicus TaxID=1437523 RepID=UPI000617D10F|nr:L-fucose/L-arabinose isomerase family protein [Domibacillus indicus]
MKKIKLSQKPRVGLYSTGLQAYWEQFPGLRERLIEYGAFIEKKLSSQAEVFNFGLVDTVEKGREAGEWFNERNVDLLFLHAATYSTSAAVLPIHQRCSAKVVILNLQPAARINYDKTTTGEWLAHCGACPVPEFANAFHRAGLSYHIISGLLGLPYTPDISLTDEKTDGRPEAVRAWKEIGEWAAAAGVKRNLANARFGLLGNTYSGMLDLYSDFTMLQAQTGIHVDVLEMCDLAAIRDSITEEEISAKRREVEEMFILAENSPAETLATKPTEEQLQRACLTAAAQETFIKQRELDGLAYYYHGAPGGDYEQLQSDFITGHSLLTAQGVPCAGEGDVKTAVAMKICDTLGIGGSFCEIVTADYEDGTILLGHDGPFHLEIAEGRPYLRGMGLYHGKQGSGISVEAKVKTGPVTMLGLTQTKEGRLKLIISEGESTDGPIMQIGNTQTPVKFAADPDTYFEKWFMEAPTHHFALSIGHNAELLKKTAVLLDIPCTII